MTVYGWNLVIFIAFLIIYNVFCAILFSRISKRKRPKNVGTILLEINDDGIYQFRLSLYPDITYDILNSIDACSFNIKTREVKNDN